MKIRVYWKDKNLFNINDIKWIYRRYIGKIKLSRSFKGRDNCMLRLFFIFS